MAVTYLWSARAASAALNTRLSSRSRLRRSSLANRSPPQQDLGPPCPRRRPAPDPEPFSRGVGTACQLVVTAMLRRAISPIYIALRLIKVLTTRSLSSTLLGG